MLANFFYKGQIISSLGFADPTVSVSIPPYYSVGAVLENM